jgi:hypothetical protein
VKKFFGFYSHISNWPGPRWWLAMVVIETAIMLLVAWALDEMDFALQVILWMWLVFFLGFLSWWFVQAMRDTRPRSLNGAAGGPRLQQEPDLDAATEYWLAREAWEAEQAQQDRQRSYPRPVLDPLADVELGTYPDRATLAAAGTYLDQVLMVDDDDEDDTEVGGEK